MKINIIGTSGSGKSTLARRIATELALPCIEMDTLYWLPEWQGTPDDVLFAKLEAALSATPGWVLDGNYNRTRLHKMARRGSGGMGGLRPGAPCVRR